MSKVMGMAIVDGEIRQVPKHGLSLDEVVFAYGRAQLVRELRMIKALVPCGMVGRAPLYDAEHIAEVWDRYRRGEYRTQLEKLPGGERRKLLGMEEEEEALRRD